MNETLLGPEKVDPLMYSAYTIVLERRSQRSLRGNETAQTSCLEPGFHLVLGSRLASDCCAARQP
jgi:hypothetical protein